MRGRFDRATRAGCWSELSRFWQVQPVAWAVCSIATLVRSVSLGSRSVVCLVLVVLTLIECGGPTREQGDCVLGCAGLRAVRGKGQAGVGGEFHDFVGKADVADDGVVKSFGAGPVQDHVVGGPPIAEGVAAGGQLADEVGQVAVVGVAAGFDAKHGDGGVGRVVPVWIQPRRVGFRNVNLARLTGRAGSSYTGEYRATRSGWPTEGQAYVQNDGGQDGEAVEDALHDGTNLLFRRGAAAARGVVVAARARSCRCACSASSRCRARAMASRTLSETPVRLPRSNWA